MPKNFPPDAPQDKPKRKRRTIDRIRLSDESAKPGLEFVERYCHAKRPTKEDEAILQAWRFQFPITVLFKNEPR